MREQKGNIGRLITEGRRHPKEENLKENLKTNVENLIWRMASKKRERKNLEPV